MHMHSEKLGKTNGITHDFTVGGAHRDQAPESAIHRTSPAQNQIVLELERLMNLDFTKLTYQ